MTPSLEGPRAKIDRAEEHLNALYGEVHAFLEPYSDFEPVYHAFDGTWHTVNVRPIIDEPPLRLSVICGDAIHNLRAALDHLVWQLVVAAGNKPSKGNSFPIYSAAKDFDRDVRFREKKRGPGPLGGIDPNRKAWTTIEQAQPYHSRRPPGDPLAMLKTLDDMDKHRTLAVHALFPGEQTVWDLVGWHPAAELLEYRFANRPLSLEHETEILRLRFSEAWPNPQVGMKDRLTVEPTFGDGTIQVTAEALNFVFLKVDDLINSFG